jgi:hypothetical protein
MVAWLELFRMREQADDYRNLHLGARFADFLELDRSRRSLPVVPAQQHLS